MLDVGVMLNNLERDRLRAFQVARDAGFDLVHTSALPESWLTGPQRQRHVRAAQASGVRILAMFIGFDGQTYADLPSIRRTVGLVLPEFRPHRTQVACRYCDLAADLGCRTLAAHLGFIPHDRDDPNYAPL